MEVAEESHGSTYGFKRHLYRLFEQRHNLQHDFLFWWSFDTLSNTSIQEVGLEAFSNICNLENSERWYCQEQNEGSLQVLNLRPLNCPNNLTFWKLVSQHFVGRVQEVFYFYAGGLLYSGISRLIRLKRWPCDRVFKLLHAACFSW